MLGVNLLHAPTQNYHIQTQYVEKITTERCQAQWEIETCLGGNLILVTEMRGNFQLLMAKELVDFSKSHFTLPSSCKPRVNLIAPIVHDIETRAVGASVLPKLEFIIALQPIRQSHVRAHFG